MAIFAKPIDQMTALELQQAYGAVVREYVKRYGTDKMFSDFLRALVGAE